MTNPSPSSRMSLHSMLLKVAAYTDGVGDSGMPMRGHDDLLWHKDGPLGHAIELFQTDEAKGYPHKILLRKRMFLSKLPEFLRLLDRKLAKYGYLAKEHVVLDPTRGGKTLEQTYGGEQPWDSGMSGHHGMSIREAADGVMRAVHMTSEDGLLEYVDVLSGPMLPDVKLAATTMLKAEAAAAYAASQAAAKAMQDLGTDLNNTTSYEYRAFKNSETKLLRSLSALSHGLEEIFQWAKSALESGPGHESPKPV